MFSSCECEIIDINSDNTSIHLHSVASLQAENVEAVSGRSIMIIEKCMGVLSNFTIVCTLSRNGRLFTLVHFEKKDFKVFVFVQPFTFYLPA